MESVMLKMRRKSILGRGDSKCSLKWTCHACETTSMSKAQWVTVQGMGEGTPQQAVYKVNYILNAIRRLSF